MTERTTAEHEYPRDADTSSDFDALTETVRELVGIMRQGELQQLEVSRGDLHILLYASSRGSHAGAESTANAPVPEGGWPTTDGAGQPPEICDNGNDALHITSPMVGTFYEAPSPGERPFVSAGDHVEAGQTVAIIEAMKIMNEIVADRAGVIDAALVENGETVEYGQPLFRIRAV